MRVEAKVYSMRTVARSIELLEYLASLFGPEEEVEVAHRYLRFGGEVFHLLFDFEVPFLCERFGDLFDGANEDQVFEDVAI